MTEPTAGPFGLYRWYDVEDVPIYYGISGSMAIRQSTHAKHASWGVFAHHSTVERFSTQEAAAAAERIAIETDRPIFNRMHNDGTDARRRLEAYLTEHGRTDLLPPARDSRASRSDPEGAAALAASRRQQEAVEALHRKALASCADRYRQEKERAAIARRTSSAELAGAIHAAYTIHGMRKADIIRAIDFEWSRTWVDRACKGGEPDQEEAA